MEEIVPWVPYLDANADFVTSDNVTHYVFDQNSGDPAWSQAGRRRRVDDPLSNRTRRAALGRAALRL